MKILNLTILLILLSFISTAQQQITFKVADVKKNSTALKELQYKTVVSLKTNNIVEACSGDDKLVLTEIHPFIETLNYCYNDHRSLVLTPDMFWLLICQGFAQHINNDPDLYKTQLVNFNDKKTIKIIKDDFILGADNHWIEVFPLFTDQIKTDIGDSLYNILVPDFTTTTSATKAAFEISLMNLVKEYYVNELYTFCGIPEITIEGTYEDWKWIKDNLVEFNEYNLEWWTNEIEPILDEIINTVKGEINIEFWNNIYKTSDQSGGPYIHGWIVKFFPYIRKNDEVILNEYVLKPTLVKIKDVEWHLGLLSYNFFSGLSEVDFIWQYYLEKYEMKFVAGFIGIRQYKDDLKLKPEIGWAITK